MSRIQRRLEKVDYQTLKSKTLSDEEKILAARSIYDAAINYPEDVSISENLPTDVFGVSISWGENGNIATFEIGTDKIKDDDLTDDIRPGLNNKDFIFDGENFQLRTGEEFELR